MLSSEAGEFRGCFSPVTIKLIKTTKKTTTNKMTTQLRILNALTKLVLTGDELIIMTILMIHYQKNFDKGSALVLKTTIKDIQLKYSISYKKVKAALLSLKEKELIGLKIIKKEGIEIYASIKLR